MQNASKLLVIQFMQHAVQPNVLIENGVDAIKIKKLDAGSPNALDLIYGR